MEKIKTWRKMLKLQGRIKMNKVELCGRLTRDPEVYYTEGDNPLTITRYTIACDRRRRKNKMPEADFIPIVAFGKRGDFSWKYFKKGMRVIVVGRVSSSSYLNKNGDKVFRLEITAEDQEFADGKREETNAGIESANGDLYNDEGIGYAYETGGANISQDSGIGDGFMNIPYGVDDDMLPFN